MSESRDDGTRPSGEVEVKFAVCLLIIMLFSDVNQPCFWKRDHDMDVTH